MRYTWAMAVAALLIVLVNLPANGQAASSQVKIGDGILEGTIDAATGIETLKGVPFAAPPVGDLRIILLR